MLLKNSFGCSIAANPKLLDPALLGTFKGSSLYRAPLTTVDMPKDADEAVNSLTDIISDSAVTTSSNDHSKLIKQVPKEKKEPKSKSLSSRTKAKIRNKLQAFAGQCNKLTFLTLTFVNEVEDRQAVKTLGKFLENIKKSHKEFEYLWVAERQTQNTVFVDNLHFHLITNKFWNINRYWKYWIELQEKAGIIPRDESYKATSAFDVKAMTTKNLKSISIYLTKYVTKNKSLFTCAAWNCSKRISRLYTSFYTNFSFLRELERLEKHKQIEIKRVRQEYCNVFYYPVNKITSRFYDDLHEKNKEGWNLNQVSKNGLGQ